MVGPTLRSISRSSEGFQPAANIASVPRYKAKGYIPLSWGNLTRSTDPAYNQIAIGYDRLGRKLQLDDPDLGHWTYKVNPLGQTWQQTDAKSQTTSYTYDALGRLTRRLEPDLDSRWDYDNAAKGVGRLAEAYTWAASAKDYRRILAYDSLGRLKSVTTHLDWDYAAEYTYDTFGRLYWRQYRRNPSGGSGGPATGFITSFSPTGYPVTVSGSNLLTHVMSMDAEGRATLLLRNPSGSVQTQRGYNPYTGRLESITSGPSATPASVQNDSYQYDPVGNLTLRTQLAATAGSLTTESFSHDSLDRLQTITVWGQPTATLAYDALGNLSAKPNVGAYAYPPSGAGSVRPHALSAISGSVAGLANPGFGYDPNGNQTSGLGRSTVWTSYNKPASIDRYSGTSAVERSAMLYDSEHQRIRQTVSPISGGVVGAATRITYYAGALEKEIDGAANTTTLRTYLPGIGYLEEKFTGTALAATASTTPSVRLLLTDRQGSPEVIADNTGTVIERLSYDAWGRRRNPSGSDDTWGSLGTLADTQQHRGYTGEEQLDRLALVNLNGRMYDPIAARMLSADPQVPDPFDAQALNRYSYVLNAPLRYTDPSGYGPKESTVEERPVELPRQEILFTPSSIACPGGACMRLMPGPLVAHMAAPGSPAQQVFQRVVVSGQKMATESVGDMRSWVRKEANNGSVFWKAVDWVFSVGDGEEAAAESLGANSEVPSNVGPGPNAGESVPAGPGSRPTKEQQDKINEIGNRDGCHTCGTTDPGTKSGNWIGDHQDPTKLNPDGKPQRYYPQCQGCSNEQGGRIRWLPKP